MSSIHTSLASLCLGAAMLLGPAAQAGILSRCVAILRGPQDSEASIAAHTQSTVDFKSYELDGTGPINFESLISEMDRLKFEINTQEFELQSFQSTAQPSAYDSPLGTADSFQQLQNRQTSIHELAQKKERLQRLETLRMLSHDPKLVQTLEKPVTMSHSSYNADLTLDSVDTHFHRDPLADVRLGAHSGSGLYGFPGERQSSREGKNTYVLQIKKALAWLMLLAMPSKRSITS